MSASFLAAAWQRRADCTTDLLWLSDDCLITVFANLELGALAAMAAACLRTAQLARMDELWERLVEARWPHVRPSEGTWRALHVERARLPRWQHLWAHMDAMEVLLTKLPEGWEHALAQHTLGIAAGEVPHGASGFDEWKDRACRALAQPAVLWGLCAWLQGRSASLDQFYDHIEGAQVSHATLRATLLGAMRGLSAAELMQDHLVSKAPALAAAWGAAELPAAMRRIASDLESLHLEGFPVAVAPSLRPPGMPRSHSWWYHGPKLHYVNRC